MTKGKEQKPKELPPGMVMRGRTYCAQFRAGGRLVRKALSTDYKVACEILRDMRARADRADFGLVNNDCQWSELRKEYVAFITQTLRTPDQNERDLNYFETFSEVRNIREIDQRLVVGYREWRLAGGGRKLRKATPGKEQTPAKKPSPRTVNREVGTLRHMLNLGVQWKRIGANPIAGLKPLSTLR